MLHYTYFKFAVKEILLALGAISLNPTSLIRYALTSGLQGPPNRSKMTFCVVGVLPFHGLDNLTGISLGTAKG